MCGIFAYINHLVPKKRQEVLQVLLQGLSRLEYRGYDSAGVGIDDSNANLVVLREKGKVKRLEELILENTLKLDMDEVLPHHVGISHTRWATHGVPCEVNSHPQRSDPEDQFICVHNGIITNYKDIKQFLETKGHRFESETDTEVIAKLTLHIYQNHQNHTFQQIVELAIQQLEGAFALCFKSKHFPNECVAARRGSPLLVAIKTKERLATDHIPIMYSKGNTCPAVDAAEVARS